MLRYNVTREEMDELGKDALQDPIIEGPQGSKNGGSTATRGGKRGRDEEEGAGGKAPLDPKEWESMVGDPSGYSGGEEGGGRIRVSG